MAERSPHDPKSFDSEIGVRGITSFLIALIVGTAIVVVLVLGLYRFFQAREVAKDAPPSPLVDRTQPRVPPEPRLQTAPDVELAAMRAVEKRILESYGWVDESAGIARVPIDRAMAMLLQRGLPSRPVSPQPASVPETSHTSDPAPGSRAPEPKH